MGAQPRAIPQDQPTRTGSIEFDFIAFPRVFNHHKRRLTFGPLARTILEEIWEGTQGKLRAKGSPAPEYACFTLRDFAVAEISGRIPAASKEFEREVKALLSTAQTAIQDMIARKVISRLTAAQAKKAGFISQNSQSRWYKCNWKKWESLATPDTSPYVRPEKPEPEEDGAPEKVVAIREEKWLPVRAGRPAAWKIPESEEPVRSLKVVFSSGGKASMQKSGGEVTVEVIEKEQNRLTVDRKAEENSAGDQPQTKVASSSNTAGHGSETARKSPASANGRPVIGSPSVAGPAAGAEIETIQKECASVGLAIDEKIAARTLAEIPDLPRPHFLERLADRVARGKSGQTTPFVAGNLPKFAAEQLVKYRAGEVSVAPVPKAGLSKGARNHMERTELFRRRMQQELERERDV